MPTPPADREALPELPNPLGLAGIEFIEYATTRPQALGQVLEQMGFRPIARHRSREVLLYRQGAMNVVINAHVGAGPAACSRPRRPPSPPSRCGCATPPRPTGARWTAAPGPCPRRWR